MATLADLMETIDEYHKNGRPTGDCVRALLANDLFGFLARADQETAANFVLIARHVYNNLDGRAWGSYEKVEAWLKTKHEERAKMAQAKVHFNADEDGGPDYYV